MPLLEVFDLHAEFARTSREGGGVRGMSLRVDEREFVVLLGRSGSGKSVTLLSILGLLSDPPGITRGHVRYRGRSILPEIAVRDRRGRVSLRAWARFRRAHQRLLREHARHEIALVQQDPTGALDPQATIGSQLLLTARASGRTWNPREARDRALAALGAAGLPDPEGAFRSYPDELSGGMCQRAVIAMALLPEPSLLFADEPTSSLDASARLDVLDRLAELSRRRGLATLLVTHDIGIALSYATRIIVVAEGAVAEEGPVDRFRRAASARGYDGWVVAGVPAEVPDRGEVERDTPLSASAEALLDAAIALRGGSRR
jgi:ABC-type dipeptide/oligopeptide/nickel transport system ATPase component